MVYCKLVLQEKLNQKMAIAESLMSVLIAVIGKNIFVQVNHHLLRVSGYRRYTEDQVWRGTRGMSSLNFFSCFLQQPLN